MLKSKLDEESQANVCKIMGTGKHAAVPLQKSAAREPREQPLSQEPADQPTDLRQMEFPYATQSTIQQLDPFARANASHLADEAPVQDDGASAEGDQAGIANILKGRGRQRRPPQLSNASLAYQHVTDEALQEHKTVAADADAPAFLRKAFCLCERDDAAVDLQHLSTLQKVKVHSMHHPVAECGQGVRIVHHH